VLFDQNKTDGIGELGQLFGNLVDYADPHAFGWLVQHEKFWSPDQRAPDREHLAFAARQRGGGLSEPLAKLRKDCKYPLDAGLVLLVDRAKQQVLLYRHAAKDRVLLRHVTKSSPHAALACLFTGVPLVEPDDAAHRADLAGNRLEQCALASPIATEDCHRTP
jgi:hypothetical protein